MFEGFTPRGTVEITQKGWSRLRAGHQWVYKSDIAKILPKAALALPGIMEVVNSAGQSLGTALYSPLSTITLRMLTLGTKEESPWPDRDLFKKRILAAKALRQQLLKDRDTYRLIHGEADFLPGIFVDKYAAGIALQTTTSGAAYLEPVLIDLLKELLDPEVLVLRNNASSRAKEGLAQYTKLVYQKGKEVDLAQPAPVLVRYNEGAIVMEADLLAAQKTGSYLDQYQNHLDIRDYLDYLPSKPLTHIPQ